MQGTEQVLSRKIVISSVIDEKVAGEIIEQIMAINDFDAQMSVVTTYQPEPIEMFINSVGGNVSDGFAIIDAMEMSDTPIITYGIGIVASMALAIFVAGDVRVSARHARFMYHSISYGMVGYIQDHEDAQKESSLLQRMYNSLMFERTGLTQEKLDEIKRMKKDFFFSSKQAVKLGVADQVMPKPEKKFQMVTEEEFEKMQKEMKESE